MEYIKKAIKIYFIYILILWLISWLILILVFKLAVLSDQK